MFLILDPKQILYTQNQLVEQNIKKKNTTEGFHFLQHQKVLYIAWVEFRIVELPNFAVKVVQS